MRRPDKFTTEYWISKCFSFPINIEALRLWTGFRQRINKNISQVFAKEAKNSIICCGLHLPPFNFSIKSVTIFISCTILLFFLLISMQATQFVPVCYITKTGIPTKLKSCFLFACPPRDATAGLRYYRSNGYMFFSTVDQTQTVSCWSIIGIDPFGNF